MSDQGKRFNREDAFETSQIFAINSWLLIGSDNCRRKFSLYAIICRLTSYSCNHRCSAGFSRILFIFFLTISKRTESTFYKSTARKWGNEKQNRKKIIFIVSGFIGPRLHKKINTFGEWTNRLTNLVVVFVVFCIVSKFLVCDIFQYRGIVIRRGLLLLPRLP